MHTCECDHMPFIDRPEMKEETLKKPLMFICRQKINFILHVFLDILHTCNFWYSGHAWLCTTKVIVSTCRKLLCLSACKKSTSYPTFFSGYCKDMQTSYFGFFGHVWLHTSKMTVITCKKL